MDTQLLEAPDHPGAKVIALADARSIDHSTRSEEELTRAYLPLARRMASRFSGKGVEIDDLIQVANLALVKAIRRYDQERGAFEPFASATISGELKRHLRDFCWVVKPPRRIQELQTRITKAADQVAQQRGGDPATADLASAVDATVDETVEALSARACFSPASIDRLSPHTGRPLADSIPDEGEAFDEVDGHLTLLQICSGLSDADRELIRLRYYENCSQREMARELGISQMQVSRRLRRLIDALRDRAGELDAA